MNLLPRPEPPFAMPHRDRLRSRALSAMAAVVLSGLMAVPAAAQSSRCIDEDRIELRGGPHNDGAGVPLEAGEPKLRLQGMVQDALRLSHAVGAARVLAEAAGDDIEVARAATRPQVSINSLVGAGGSRADGSSNSGLQAQAGVNISALFYDAGRNAQLTDWRRQLAESARQGQLGTEEQIALQTVSLAIERSRFRLQVQIFQQFSRKMSCLVEALEEIVRADRGRASELVQARKTLQQADLQVAQSQSAVRQVETRLRRLVGDGLPSPEGMSSLLLAPPPLPEVVAQAESSPEIVRLQAAARAAESLARATAAESRPTASWVFGGSKTVGADSGNPANWSAGVQLNIPLVSPAQVPATNAAQRRAEAARLQLADAVESRRFRIAEVHEQATAAFDRARRAATLTRDTDRLRNFTLQQWQQLGRRSLFDVMASETEHYTLRAAYVNALHDGQQSTAQLRSLGRGITEWLQ